MDLIGVTNTRKIVLFCLILSCNIITSQTKGDNYYSLVKNGREYLKPVKYVLFNKEKDKKHISNDSDGLIFYVSKQQFRYSNLMHNIDTCSISVLEKIKISTVKQLFDDEYVEHKSKLKLEELKWFPPPLNHYNLKIFIIEKTTSNQIIKYEVDWIFSIE